MPRGMWGVLLYGSLWRPQYCRGKCRRLQYCLCQGGCRVLYLQAYRVWSLVSWFDLYAMACFLRSSLGPFRAGVPGRKAPVGPGRASRRRTVSRVSVNPGRRRGVRVESSTFGPSLPIGEAVRRRLKSEASAPIGEVGRSSRRAGTSFLDTPSGR